MIKDIVEYTNYLIEHGISAEQDVICRLLASEQEGYRDLPSREEAFTNFYAYWETILKGSKDDRLSVLKHLEDKGFIKYLGDEPNNPNYDDYYVTKKFLDIAYEKIPDKWDQYDEFWQEYPRRHKENGKNFVLKATNKEELFKEYKKHLSKKSHRFIMKALKIAKAKNELNMKIDIWLKSEQYMEYEDEVINGVDEQDVGEIEQTIL